MDLISYNFMKICRRAIPTNPYAILKYHATISRASRLSGRKKK